MSHETVILKKAMAHFGSEAQMRKLMEEMAECTVAVMHFMDGKGSLDYVIEEMADVSIVLDQFRLLMDEAFESHRAHKLTRLDARLIAEARPMPEWQAKAWEEAGRVHKPCPLVARVELKEGA